MKRILTLLSLGLASLNTSADMIETRVTLPDGLGHAMVYHDDALEETTAAVIVVHEWWGLNDYARNRARMLARHGYVAMAVDMYGTGKVATHPTDAKAFMEAAMAEPEKMNARFQAARRILLRQQFVDPNRVYAIGYCFGGAVVLNQARQGADLAGVASFHGSLSTQTPAKKGEVQARVLVATGQADPTIPANQVTAFVEEMTQAGVDFQLLSFPGVKHSFTNPRADEFGKRYDLPLAYDAHADQASWRALLQMLRGSD